MKTTAPCRTYTVKGQSFTYHFGECPACVQKKYPTLLRAFLGGVTQTLLLPVTIPWSIAVAIIDTIKGKRR